MMNKFIAIVLGSLLLTSMALADRPSEGKCAGKHKGRLLSKLELTEEQQQPVAEILEQQREKTRETMQAAFEQVRPPLQALHAETRQRLAEVLTGEQLQQYDKLSSRRHERMQKRFERR